MAAFPQAFYCLWQEDRIREKLFDILSPDDLCAVRLANSACCNLITKRLFLRTHLTFNANTFTRPARIQALSRIGHHIEHLTFDFPHSDATFLPPLIHPQTGTEIAFLYTPHTSMASVLARPKYANSELGEILTQQYPPLFHAASNVPSFINAVKHMPNMRHLTIRTPGQDPKERYRRDIVDYALISLRISLERTALRKLSKLSLSGVHPSALQYLRHVPGFGASPAAARMWRQIRKLYISVESWDFYGPCPGLDHLKIIDDFIRQMSPQLEKFTFTWLGRRGPCPIALAGDPLFSPPRSSKKLFNEVTGPMSPLPARPERKPMVMPRLRYMQIRNATMNAPQLSALVANHKATVREFDFENVVLIYGGSWDEALAPLNETTSSGSDAWSRYSLGGSETSLPLPQSSPALGSGSGSASSHQGDELPIISSAAADAASKELFDVDLEGMSFGGLNDHVDAVEAGVEEWARGVTAAAHEVDLPFDTISEELEDRDEHESQLGQDDDGLASDIEAARQASLAFTTRITKQRIRRRRSRKHHSKDSKASNEAVNEKEVRQSQVGPESPRGSRSDRSHHSHRSRHKHSHSDETHERHHSRHRSASSHRHRSHRRRHSDEPPQMPDMPEVIGSDDEFFRPPRTPRSKISAPILNPDPLPVLLQPTVYDPCMKTGAVIGVSAAGPDHGLSAVQLTIEAELLVEAEDAAARSSALKRAKETVLAKLSLEFCKRKPVGSHTKDSAAVSAGLSSLHLGMPSQASGGLGGYGSNPSMGQRLRDGLFGRSVANVTNLAMAQDHCSFESQSALVPLMFSRG